MTFREKTAWALLVILSVGAWYYANRVIGQSAGMGAIAPPDIQLVISYIVLIVIASIIAMSVIGASNAKDANAPADERERPLIDKAGNWSGIVLGMGIIGGLLHYSVQSDGNMLFHITFGSLMLSQITEYAGVVFLFRRGV